ncbi:hypothetical protein H2204_004983 [Knufia peltigerae]|nr:hypothetical protein H2204_004983 [Knufia peltigerae]
MADRGNRHTGSATTLTPQIPPALTTAATAAPESATPAAGVDDHAVSSDEDGGVGLED